jgi:hypothetical protein
LLDKLRFIADNLTLGNHEWFLAHGIVAKNKGDYWVLNYQQFADKNEYNVLTRGLVIARDGTIASCPFFRFFNYGEPHAARVDFDNADVLEKLDGSLVGVFFPEGDVTQPVWHFRSLISAYARDRGFAIKGFVLNEAETPLLMEVEPFLNHVRFSDDLKDHSLVFEFISRANAVITRYEPHQHGLYLIGARHLTTLRELSEDELDELAKRLTLRRPRRWRANSYEEVRAMMAHFPQDYEGFVIRDRSSGERIKIKSEDYLRRHRLLTKLNYRSLVPVWLQGERGEIEAYFPQTVKIFDEIAACHRRFVEQAVSLLQSWRDRKATRKEVALGIVGKQPRHLCAVVFKVLETTGDVEQEVTAFVRTMRTDVLIEAWGLKDDLVEGVEDEIIA